MTRWYSISEESLYTVGQIMDSLNEFSLTFNNECFLYPTDRNVLSPFAICWYTGNNLAYLKRSSDC